MNSKITSIKKCFNPCWITTLLFSTTLSIAQEHNYTTKGTFEMSGSISFSNYTAPAADVSYSVLNIAPQVSYFLMDGFSIGLTTGLGILPGFTVTSGDGGGTTTFQLFASPAYHFKMSESRFVPFVEGQIGYAIASDDEFSSNGLSYGGRAGIKFIPVNHLVLNFAAQFLSIRLHSDDYEGRFGWDYWTVGIGVGAYL